MNPEKKEARCENQESERETLPSESWKTDDVPEQAAQEINVHYEDSPLPQRNRKIHPRQRIPLVPEGEEVVSDDKPSPPVELD
jgi:hypothetical protein